MRRVENPELKRQILNHLASLYKIKEVREPNHLSSYVYCLTKGFLDQKQAIEPTDEEVLLFALGYGLQDVLTPKGAEGEVYRRNGIIYSPDMQMGKAEIERLVELKTTRKSAKQHYQDEYLSETWLAYMMGGCNIRGTDQYDLIVLYMMGNYAPPFPQIYCDTFYFDQDELEANWEMLMERKSCMDSCLGAGAPPRPFQWCYLWECKYCRYKLVCEVLVRVQNMPNPHLEEDKTSWR